MSNYYEFKSRIEKGEPTTKKEYKFLNEVVDDYQKDTTEHIMRLNVIIEIIKRRNRCVVLMGK